MIEARVRTAWTVAAALLATAAAAGHAQAPCRFHVPADLDAVSARWWADCPGGMAEAPGVLRAGTGEPFAFFAGRMRAGLPASGLLMLRDGGWIAAVRFDRGLRAVVGNGPQPAQDDRVFAQAVAGARAAAVRFRRAGNAASAAYYDRLARRIVDGRPE